MEPKDSLRHSQELSTCPYFEPNQSKSISYLSKIRLNIIQPPTTWQYWWSISLVLSQQQLIRVHLLLHSCYMPHPSHPPWLDIFHNTWRRVQITKLLLMQCLHPPITSSLFVPNIFLSSLISNTLSLYASLNVRNNVSHPYRKTGNVIKK
jgi:hypothetical protein